MPITIGARSWHCKCVSGSWRSIQAKVSGAKCSKSNRKLCVLSLPQSLYLLCAGCGIGIIPNERHDHKNKRKCKHNDGCEWLSFYFYTCLQAHRAKFDCASTHTIKFPVEHSAPGVRKGVGVPRDGCVSVMLPKTLWYPCQLFCGWLSESERASYVWAIKITPNSTRKNFRLTRRMSIFSS